MSRALVGITLASGLGAAACWSYDPSHCASREGDASCATGQFCDACRGENFGCVDVQPIVTCHAPGGHDVGSSDTTLGTTSEGTESTTTSSTGPMDGSSESTGIAGCAVNADCMGGDPLMPFCEPTSGECVACDAFGAEADAACGELDPMAPLCVNGACVACTPENSVVCDDQLLLCDAGTNTCTQCTEHEQCGSGACELATGLCFPEDLVVHVDGDGGQDYMTIAAAVTAVDDGTHGVIVVHELDGSGSYQTAGGLLIDGGKTIALLAAPAEAPIIQGTGMGNPGLRVEGLGTVLYVDGLTASLSPGVGLRVDGAFAWVDRSRIVANSGGGIVAQNAAELTLRNCFVGGGTDVIGVEVVDASASVLYSTISASTFDTTPALSCTTPVAVDVRNSIIVSQGGASPDELSCGVATVTSSATEADVGPFSAGWFVNFNGGDYHLTASGTAAFADVANWSTGDPSTDIDGDARPATDGTADYAGADVP